MAYNKDYTLDELKKKSASEVESDLRDIEKYYKNNNYLDAPDSLGLKKKQLEEKTDSDFENLAKSTLASKYKTKKENTTNDFSRQIENLLQENENNKRAGENAKNEINQAYDNSIKETENQALRRGLARSSVVINQISALEGGRANNLAEVINDLETKLSESESKMQQLESERAKALEDLDLEYAVELENEINKAKSEYEKQKNEVIEFNNNVDKLEAEYKLKLEDQKLDKQKKLGELENEGSFSSHEVIRDKQYEYLKDYLDSLDKDFAYALLSANKNYKDILGNSLYEQLLSYLKNK